MKKVISVILAAVMLACCLPFAVFAEDPDGSFTTSGTFASSHQLESGKTYRICSGATMTVPSTLSLYIPEGTRLEIEQGGTLDVLGSVYVAKSGSLYAYGTINHSSNISLNTDPLNEGEFPPNVQVQFRFPALNADGINLNEKIDVRFAYGSGDNVTVRDVPVEGGSYFVPLNSEVKIYAQIREPDANRDKFDDSLLKLKFNNVGLTYTTGPKAGDGYFETTASTGGDVSYTKWTNDSDFLTVKKIVLPAGEGYECVPRDPDKVRRTEDGTIIVKYGEPFSFKVELDEGYDMSHYEVSIYNGYGWLNLVSTGEEIDTLSLENIAAQPDDYGYYNIPEVTGDITVSVTGVMKNSTINLIGNLLETFRNIFNMLKEFFESIKDLFTGMNG